MKIHRYFFWIEDNFIEIYKKKRVDPLNLEQLF